MAQWAARRRLPPQGVPGSDTSINLQEMSIPCHTPPSCCSSSLSPPVPGLLFRCRAKTCFSPEQKSQITNTCIFLPSQPGGFQYAMDFHLTFSIIHLSFFFFWPRIQSPGCRRLVLSFCLSRSRPWVLKSSIHAMTRVSRSAYGHQQNAWFCAVMHS